MKLNQHNRREFLKMVGAVAAGVVLPVAVVAADIKPAVNEKEFKKWAYRRGTGEFKLYYLGDPVCVHVFEIDLRKRKRFIRIDGPSYCVDIDTSAISISETKDAFGNLKLRFMDSSIMKINAPAAAENSKS